MTSPSEDVPRFLCRVGVAQLCKHVGVQSITRGTVDEFVSIVQSYVENIGRTAARNANDAGRTKTSLDDVAVALEDIRVRSATLERYLLKSRDIPFARRVTNLPALLDDQTSAFASAAENGKDYSATAEASEARLAHVPTYLPPLPRPESEKKDGEGDESAEHSAQPAEQASSAEAGPPQSITSDDTGAVQRPEVSSAVTMEPQAQATSPALSKSEDSGQITQQQNQHQLSKDVSRPASQPLSRGTGSTARIGAPWLLDDETEGASQDGEPLFPAPPVVPHTAALDAPIKATFMKVPSSATRRPSVLSLGTVATTTTSAVNSTGKSRPTPEKSKKGAPSKGSATPKQSQSKQPSASTPTSTKSHTQPAAKPQAKAVTKQSPLQRVTTASSQKPVSSAPEVAEVTIPTQPTSAKRKADSVSPARDSSGSAKKLKSEENATGSKAEKSVEGPKDGDSKAQPSQGLKLTFRLPSSSSASPVSSPSAAPKSAPAQPSRLAQSEKAKEAPPSQPLASPVQPSSAGATESVTPTIATSDQNVKTESHPAATEASKPQKAASKEPKPGLKQAKAAQAQPKKRKASSPAEQDKKRSKASKPALAKDDEKPVARIPSVRIKPLLPPDQTVDSSAKIPPAKTPSSSSQKGLASSTAAKGTTSDASSHAAPPTDVAENTKASSTEPTYYCICRSTNEDDPYICCDHCEQWFHPACVNLTLDPQFIDKLVWVCPDCNDKAKPLTPSDVRAFVQSLKLKKLRYKFDPEKRPFEIDVNTIFGSPVDVPGYKEKVPYPMDLSKIAKDAATYPDPASLCKSLSLIVINCHTFNIGNPEFMGYADQLQEQAGKAMKTLVSRKIKAKHK